ncbi:MAG: hypothetical protein ACI35V_01860 [Sphingobacterium composti]|uniref:hypothetical protein n=1 Tax=Sphingobacterium composti TaxID=363260 RepID=UPI00135AADDB|nr:hypothetical protein [Sphingobacterium composti Ten et al. 2007 non Yoo et al. 2007]
MTNYFLIALLMILNYTSIAQTKSTLFDSLDKEFRYKVIGKTLQDRGEDLLMKELVSLLAKTEVFKDYEDGISNFTIHIDYTNKIPSIEKIDYWTKDTNRALRCKNDLSKYVNQLLSDFKPAVYQGNAFYRKYRIDVQIKKEKKLNIYRIRFDKTRPDYYLNTNCFEIYREKSDNHLFNSVEIFPEYKGGKEILISHLNKLFKSSRIGSNNKIDSLDIDFIITKDGHFSLEGNYMSKSKTESIIIENLKLLSCNWFPGLMSGRPFFVKNKYRFYYTAFLNYTGKVNLKIYDLKRVKNY